MTSHQNIFTTKSLLTLMLGTGIICGSQSIQENYFQKAARENYFKEYAKEEKLKYPALEKYACFADTEWIRSTERKNARIKDNVADYAKVIGCVTGICLTGNALCQIVTGFSKSKK